MKHVRLQLFGPTTLLLAVAFLVIDACTLPPSSSLSLRPRARAAPFDPGGYDFSRADGGGWQITEDPAKISGRVWPFVRQSPTPSIWAPTGERWSVTVSVMNHDGTAASPQQLRALGTALSDVRWQPGSTAWLLLRAGGGTGTQRLLGGYFHNLTAAAVAALAIASIPRSMKALVALRRTRRTRRGHCPACNYDRRGLAVEVECPECGKVSA